jgi:hypothetical protein
LPLRRAMHKRSPGRRSMGTPSRLTPCRSNPAGSGAHSSPAIWATQAFMTEFQVRPLISAMIYGMIRVQANKTSYSCVVPFILSAGGKNE